MCMTNNSQLHNPLYTALLVRYGQLAPARAPSDRCTLLVECTVQLSDRSGGDKGIGSTLDTGKPGYKVVHKSD